MMCAGGHEARAMQTGKCTEAQIERPCIKDDHYFSGAPALAGREPRH